VIRRIAAAALMLWALGFLWFAVALPGPAGAVKTDAVIVPTGAAGRIERGIEVVREGQAGALLVTGAVDTRSNATETARWVERRKVRSLRLVTSDWHMRRAAGELARTLPEGVEVVRDGVPSRPSLRILVLEYHKLLASTAARVVA
jgi:hypothetical protein